MTSAVERWCYNDYTREVKPVIYIISNITYHISYSIYQVTRLAAVETDKELDVGFVAAAAGVLAYR